MKHLSDYTVGWADRYKTEHRRPEDNFSKFDPPDHTLWSYFRHCYRPSTESNMVNWDSCSLKMPDAVLVTNLRESW